MANTERTEKLAQRSLWDELIALRDEQRQDRRNGLQVVKRDELPLENNPMGLIQWYLHPAIKDTSLNTLMFYRQEIPPGSRSGRVKFQGGQVIFVTEGKGRTIIDGVAHAWEARDVLNLPLKPDGIIVQHINDDPANRAVLLCAEANLFDTLGVDRGSGFELIEPSPDFKPKK